MSGAAERLGPHHTGQKCQGARSFPPDLRDSPKHNCNLANSKQLSTDQGSTKVATVRLGRSYFPDPLCRSDLPGTKDAQRDG